MSPSPADEDKATETATCATLEKDLHALQGEFLKFADSDLDSHQKIEAAVLHNGQQLSAVGGKFATYVFAGRIIWGGVGILLVVLSSMLGWITAELGRVDDRVQDVHAEQMAQEIRSDAILRSIMEIQQDIRELRQEKKQK